MRFSSKLSGENVGIPLGPPLDADLFLFHYERDFMLSRVDNNQAVVIEASNTA